MSAGSIELPADALRVAGALLLAVRTLEQKLRTVAGADALSLTDIGVLVQIDAGVDLPSQVARALRLDPARVTHVTDRLVEYGLIERGIDPRDRRCWRLNLTATGRQRLEEARADTSGAVDALLEGLTRDERTALLTGLDALRRDLFMEPAVQRATPVAVEA